MMTGQLGWEKLDLLRFLKHLAAILHNMIYLNAQYSFQWQIYQAGVESTTLPQYSAFKW